MGRDGHGGDFCVATLSPLRIGWERPETDALGGTNPGLTCCVWLALPSFGHSGAADSKSGEIHPEFRRYLAR